ncbi:hypothetical protein [Rivibacter subsaxonicus]|uniref:Uncharacterized protein n=1 Tax=Rivibacter subsaxonicus TaxID=457575 RepID=A0A4Q7VZK6_9BURK|nr:hypothetical protein [Rivibacter subsaxonicus]RZU02143.1 hypothetical protein EV670_0162 [Rivibacter subsaxonicus]
MNNKKPWLKYVLIGTLVSFVLLDLFIIVSGTRILASALQPAPAPAPGAQALVLVCEYFTGTGFETRTFPASAGLASCPVFQ